MSEHGSVGVNVGDALLPDILGSLTAPERTRQLRSHSNRVPECMPTDGRLRQQGRKPRSALAERRWQGVGGRR